jgi:hypothetical protein
MRPDGADRKRWISYIGLLLFHTKVTWAMWLARDLTTGDTASYFVSAYGWHVKWSNNLAWSPLYTSYYGALLSLGQDVYVATIAHRLVASLVSSMLVLSVARTVVREPWAWLVAAWWTVLPIIHDTLYEVHLFSVLPILVAYRLGFGGAHRWRRGAVLGVMAGAAVLVRNELSLAVAVMGLAFAHAEWRARSGERGREGGVLKAYGVPLAACGVLIAVAYGLSTVKYPALKSAWARKHTHNVCQVYAFGYQQRSHEWTGSPWTECGQLMRATFGVEEPTLLGAFRANPRAMVEHVVWNAGLIGNGLQVLLFDGTAGAANPDYAPVKTGVAWVWFASAACLALIAYGAWRVAGCPALRQDIVMARTPGWITAAGVAAVSVVVMLTQRPRPSYLFGLAASLMMMTGIGADLLFRRWAPARAAWTLAAVVVAATILVPGTYRSGEAAPRPLLAAYRRLKPYRERIQVPGRVLVTPGYGFEICAYLVTDPPRRCDARDYYRLREGRSAGQTWPDVLAASGANMVYADEVAMADRAFSAFVANADRWGWSVVGKERSRRARWVLLEATASGTAQDGGPASR